MLSTSVSAKLLLASACFISAALAMESDAMQEASIPRDSAAACFELAARLAKADDGALWGHSLAGPILVVDSASREILANQADGEGQLVERDGLWTGRLPDNIQPANTSLEWAGVRWTMVLWNSIANSPYERGRLLLHESFHRIQPALGHEAASPPNSHLDDEAGRTWLRLEMRALAEAMIRQGDERKSAACDALLFRDVRHLIAGTAAISEEEALEANEGLAEYTGLRLSGMPVATQEQRLAVDLERAEVSQTMTRSFAYVTGTSWAFLLDGVVEDWRKSPARDMRLARKYGTAVGYHSIADQRELLKEAQSVAVKRYRGDEVFREEAVRAARRAARLAELNAMFDPARCLRIATGSGFRFSFDPNTAESLGGQRIFYRSVSASDEWGTLEAPEGAVIDFSGPMSVSLPLPPGATPDSVPWKLELKAPWRLNAPQNEAWSVSNER